MTMRDVRRGWQRDPPFGNLIYFGCLLLLFSRLRQRRWCCASCAVVVPWSGFPSESCPRSGVALGVFFLFLCEKLVLSVALRFV